MTLAQPTPYHVAIAMKSPDHLKQWLAASGREFVIFKSTDLIDALPWPDGVDLFMQAVEAYRQHRMSQPTEQEACPKLRLHRDGVVCSVCQNRGYIALHSKTDVLTLEELRAAAVYLINQIREKDPDWNPFRESDNQFTRGPQVKRGEIGRACIAYMQGGRNERLLGTLESLVLQTATEQIRVTDILNNGSSDRHWNLLLDECPELKAWWEAT